MKYTLTFCRATFNIICLISILSIIVKGEAEEYKALNVELDSFLKGWTEAYNKRDINALVNKYDEKADVIYFDGVQRNGREGMKIYFEEQFSQYKGVTESITDVNRKFLSPSIAIETGIWHRAGNTDPLAPTRGRYSCTLSKINGSWQIMHDRAWALKDFDSDGSKLKAKAIPAKCPWEWMLGDWTIERSDGTSAKVNWVKPRENADFLYGTWIESDASIVNDMTSWQSDRGHLSSNGHGPDGSFVSVNFTHVELHKMNGTISKRDSKGNILNGIIAIERVSPTESHTRIQTTDGKVLTEVLRAVN